MHGGQQYVALLRGINVGGNVLIKMSDLKIELEKAGLKNVVTILASGNIIFESNEKDTHKLAEKVEAALEKKYKRKIRAIVRHLDDLRQLEKAKPFKGIEVTKDTRLYVTFLDKKPAEHLKTTSEFFRVLKTSPFAVCSVLVLTPKRGTLDLMSSLEKHYGRDITTRNWNTVQKILKLAV